jgi:hypothetical protein
MRNVEDPELGRYGKCHSLHRSNRAVFEPEIRLKNKRLVLAISLKPAG